MIKKYSKQLICIIISVLFFISLLEKKEVISEKPASPTSIFSKSSFKKYVIPELTKIFQVRELHIRHLLLKYFSYYVELFDRNDIEEIIFPQVIIKLILNLKKVEKGSLGVFFKCF